VETDPETAPKTALRLIRHADAERLAALQYADREILDRWEPARQREYYTTAGQRQLIDRLLAQYAAGSCRPWVIESGGELVGRLTLREITGRPFYKGTVGYWVAAAYTGRGHATRALRLCLRAAAHELRLHRIEASTQVANVASQRVLRACGFTLMGVAHEHIHTAGAWHDELLWERLLDLPAAQEGR